MSRSAGNLIPCKEPLVSFTWAGLARPVHEGIVAQLVVIRAGWEARGGQSAYQIRSWWGYAKRDCESGAHPRGIALDINPAENPMCPKRTPCPCDMPEWFIALFKGQGFGWGGEWKSKCDAMHFSKLRNEGGNGRIYEVPLTVEPGPKPVPPSSLVEEDDNMLMFWHKGGLYLLSGGYRSVQGLNQRTCEALTAAGVKRVGTPEDDSELFHMIPPFSK